MRSALDFVLKRMGVMPFDATWQVPSHETIELGERRTRYCVVVPVLNEGERFLSQLERMAAARIPDVADMLIADGDSSDGSTERYRLNDLGVRTLLVKKDAGRLSAQLRIGYASRCIRGMKVSLQSMATRRTASSRYPPSWRRSTMAGT